MLKTNNNPIKTKRKVMVFHFRQHITDILYVTEFKSVLKMSSVRLTDLGYALKIETCFSSSVLTLDAKNRHLKTQSGSINPLLLFGPRIRSHPDLSLHLVVASGIHVQSKKKPAAYKG